MTSQLNIDTIDAMERGQSGFNEKSSNCPPQSPSTFRTDETKTSESQLVSMAPESPKTWIKRLVAFFGYLKNDQNYNTDSASVECVEGIRRLEDCANGYPITAAYLDSDENFMIYRRFGYLQARMLLRKQDELRELEEDLKYSDDEHDNEEKKQRLISRDVDDAKGGERIQLLEKIEAKFNEYATLLCHAQQLVALSRPASLDQSSVRNWFDYQKPIVDEELWMHHKEDLVTLKPGRENAWLDWFVERMLQKMNSRVIRYIFRSKETRAKTSGHTVYFTKKRVDCLVTLIITAMILALLIIPVYLLWNLSEEMQTQKTNAITIGVLLSFTLIFSAVLSFFTKAQRHEILGAAAAYCAVLVVFISNGANKGNISLGSFKEFGI